MRLHSGCSAGRSWDPALQHVFDPLLGTFRRGVLRELLALHQTWQQAVRTMSARPCRCLPCIETRWCSAAATMSG